MAVILPDMPDTSLATLGKDYLLSVNTGTLVTPIWTLVGGQKSGTLGRTAKSIDVSSKTSQGWTSTLPGMKSWKIDLDALVMLADTGMEALEAAYDLGKPVHVQFKYPDLKFRTGWAAITDLSIDTPADGEASMKGSLEGNGPLSALTEGV